MKRIVPLLITALGGFVLIGAYFIPPAQSWGRKGFHLVRHPGVHRVHPRRRPTC